MGKTYLTNVYGKQVKILDKSQYDKELSVDEYLDEVLPQVQAYDIVFVSPSEKIRTALDEKGIDFDLFYPSKERRGEFIENQVIKRQKPSEIARIDHSFDTWVEQLDESDLEHQYKHKMESRGMYLMSYAPINKYIESIKEQKSNND